MTSQKCQSKPGQKVHSLIIMDKFKMTERFFLCLSKMGLFLLKFLVKKLKILVVSSITHSNINVRLPKNYMHPFQKIMVSIERNS